jgi:DNA-binding CsgD family transcriptional regulator
MTGLSTVNRIVLRGRGPEQEALTDLLAATARGNGGATLLHGETGIGKTAILNWTAAAATNLHVLATAGCEREANLVFAGLHRLLRPVLDRALLLPAAQAELLTRAVDGGCDPGELLPLSVAVLALLAEVAKTQPVLCCIDDAHWLDQSTMDVLAFVSRRLSAEPIAFVFASCDGVVAASDLIADVSAVRIGGLDHHTAREMLNDLVPEGLVGDVAGALAAVAGGNPRALVDLARSLSPEQRRGEAAPPASLPTDSGLRRTYRNRLGGLPADARWLVLLCAADQHVAIRELDVTDLMRAAKTCGMDIAALEPAELANVVHVSGTEVVFGQPLVSAIVYDEATFAQRRSAHQLLAEILDPLAHRLRHSMHLAAAADGPDNRLADELRRAALEPGSSRATTSRALERAAELTTEPLAAANYLVAAARHAWEGGEPHRARLLLRKVRSHHAPHVTAQTELLLGEIELRSGATTHARQALLSAAGDLGQDRHLALTAMLRAGEALLLSGDYPRYADVAKKAQTLRRSDEPIGTQLMFEQFAGMEAMFKGDYSSADPPLRRVVNLAHTLDDPIALTQATISAILLGDDIQAYRLAIRAASVARANGDISTVPKTLELAAAAEFALGRYDSATTTLLEALPLARASGQESLASSILATLAVLAALLGDKETCMQRVREAREHTTSHGVNRPEAIIEWALGVLDLVYGRPAEALTRLKTLLSPKTGHGQLVIQIAATPHLVEAAVRVGQMRPAVLAQSLFHPWAVNTGNPAWLALAARCRALIAGEEGEAEAHYREALQFHALADSDSDFERARTELLFGQELRRGRRPSAAREHLRSALEAFRRFDAQPWIEQATAELRAAGDQVEHRDVDIAEALTPQQLQIARLAAAGATNREVAAQMFLSTRTVDHHMRNIFARLGIRSRIDLARLIT